VNDLKRGLDIPAVGSLDRRELLRYSRHLVMPEVGAAGQERLKAARVLVVGAGGLGSPLGLYLAAAGIGTLGVVEFDRVEESNLQRQILYGQSDVGRPKMAAALERLREINPLIDIVPHEVRLDSGNALEIFADYDVIADGTDNFATRYLINDACVLSGKPDVYGAIFRFEGQVSVFWGKEGPCYRCLFPEPPPPGTVPSCAEGGVLGVLPGIIGALQANEVVKLALGVGEPAVGRLLLFDGLKLRFRELKLRKNPACPVCSESPPQTGLIDYERFCAGPEADPDPEPAATDEFELSVQEFKSWRESGREVVVLDVREPYEHAIGHLEGSLLLPLGHLVARFEELDRDTEIVIYCHTGVRSAQAGRFLQHRGFGRVRNLTGGIEAWSLEIDPSMPRY